MSDDQANPPNPPADPAAQPGDPQKRPFGLRVKEDGMQTQYANAFRTHTTTDEVLVDFGFNLVTLNRAAGEDGKTPAGTLQLDWQQRVILNYRTAKGLTVELSKIIRAYEERFGEIKPPQQGPGSAPGQPPASDRGV